MRIVVIIPTFNERGNIGPLIEALQAAFASLSHTMRILVVDDNSPDGTALVVREQQRRWSSVHLLQGEKRGLGAACIRGMRHALGTLQADAVVEMDADFSHKPADVPRLIAALERGADIAIGSRYVPGGSTPRDWGWYLRLSSWLANLIARRVAGLRGVRDCTAGFRAIRGNVLRHVGFGAIRVRGYAFQMALLYAAVADGATVVELPVEFVDRTVGESKRSVRDIVEFVGTAFRLRLQSRRTLRNFAGRGNR
jgi:dolichol-phosphate mannosyltransferase